MGHTNVAETCAWRYRGSWWSGSRLDSFQVPPSFGKPALASTDVNKANQVLRERIKYIYCFLMCLWSCFNTIYNLFGIFFPAVSHFDFSMFLCECTVLAYRRSAFGGGGSNLSCICEVSKFPVGENNINKLVLSKLNVH